MHDVGLRETARAYVDALVHPSAKSDALTAARHRAFIALRLFGSFAALACLPVYLVVRGVPSAIEVGVFAWLVLPILNGWYLSRTGNFDPAHVLSAVSLAALVTAIAYQTGGIMSFATVWLVIVPIEAALCASRRVAAVASLTVVAAVAILLFAAPALTTPLTDGGQAALAAVAVVTTTLCAIALARGAQTLARSGFDRARAADDRHRLLARNMADIVTRHGRNGIVLSASPAAQTVLGVAPEELNGHGLFDRVHVADRPAYRKALSDAATSGETQTVEFRVRRDGGTSGVAFVPMEMRCRRIDLDDVAGEGAGSDVVSTLRDLTPIHERERELIAARAEAERANAAKSHFLATMSHELRTPLNAVIGFSDMLINADSLNVTPARRHEYAKLINESGHHLLSVVNGILDMSKIESGDFAITPEPFDVADVVRSACELVSLKARAAEVTITLDVAADLPEIIADKRAVKQIVLNLLANAIKFSHRGGIVTVAAAAHGGMLSLSIADTGVGISPDDLPRIGDPFFQARGGYDRPHDGTGLGLSIVRGLVDLHGGTFDIDSRLNEGTRVTVRLPLDCEAPRVVAAPRALAVAHPNDSARMRRRA